MLNRIGQLFITGYDGRTPSPEFLEFFESEGLGGVILFEENATPHRAAEDAIRTLATSSPSGVPFVAVDQEGGRVCRFRGAPAEYMAASEYGRKGDLNLYSEHFSRSAYYLHALGINLFLGPVADLGIESGNACLAGRTFGSSPASAIPFIEQTVKICHKIGLVACLKHFPGLGAARIDPHRELAVADYDSQTFFNREGLAFRAGIDAGVDMVMTTHLMLPKIDSSPAIASEKIINRLLRKRLGFDGLVVTDDLFMKGCEQLGDFGERAVKAFQAGHDLLLFGKDWRRTREAVKYFKDTYLRGEISDERLKMSLERISGVKSKLAMPVL